MRNEKECVCSGPNCCDTEQRSASQPGSVASGTPCTCISENSETQVHLPLAMRWDLVPRTSTKKKRRFANN